MRVRFEVTEDDIQQGVKDDPCFCPIALSVKRGLGLRGKKAESLEIAYNTFSVEGPDESRAHLGSLPQPAAEFLEQFDEGEWIDPFAFDMDFRQKNLVRAGITPPKEAS